jgi:lipoate-protein ligase B
MSPDSSGFLPVIEIRRNFIHQEWTYAQLDKRQRVIAEGVRTGKPGAILISELAPVITLGRRASQADLLLPQAEFDILGIEIIHSDRGGLATYHGPGQWVIYVVDSMERLFGEVTGAKKLVHFLLNAALVVCQKYIPDAHVKEGCELGVWSNTGKLASVGVHIDKGVSLHGVAINGYRTEESFFGIKPCGLNAQVDYLFHPGEHKKIATPKEVLTFDQKFRNLEQEIVDAVLKDYPL